MLSTRTSRWSAGTAVACIGLVAAAWFLLIAPRRADAASTREAQAAAQQANDVLKVKVAQLRAQSAELPATRLQLARLREQLAPTADLPGLVRTISRMATAAGTELRSITPGAATVLGGTTAAGSGSGATAPAASGSRVVAVPLTIEATGDYYQAVGFVRQLQTSMTRALLVTNIQVDRLQSGGVDGVKITITGNVYTMTDGTASASGAGATSASASSAAGRAAAVASSGARSQ